MKKAQGDTPSGEACPFPIDNDDGTAAMCRANGHCGCEVRPEMLGQSSPATSPRRGLISRLKFVASIQVAPDDRDDILRAIEVLSVPSETRAPQCETRCALLDGDLATQRAIHDGYASSAIAPYTAQGVYSIAQDGKKHCTDCNRVIVELPIAPRPMDTAPKDENGCLAYSPSFYRGKGGWVAAVWINNGWHSNPGGWHFEPTHWLPFPEKPNA